ncbi:MAG: RDD family protein [Pseudomonadales bacterium]|jgi:uncharacterized RDD family membrane protein YckC|nr:RDD family protein [Pseudomonadales bacterium]MBP9034171.1 RDD family protein [Pseudomonadales bacterium]
MTSSPAGSPDTLPPPGLLRRLAAMLYDSLLVFAVAWTVTALAVFLRLERVGESAIRASGKAAASGLLLQLAIAVALVLFFGWFWTRSGQTLGMQAWRLRVQQPDGSPISWRQALVRMGGAVLSALCLGAGYWWLLFDRERRTWHDRLSGTRVVLLPKRA